MLLWSQSLALAAWTLAPIKEVLLLDLLSTFAPLASQQGEIAGVPYLLQSEAPLLLANTAFGYHPNALSELGALFNSVGAPLAFTLPHTHPAVAQLQAQGFAVSHRYSLCQSQSSPRAFWTEQVSWAEAWNLSELITQAYGAEAWRFPFTQVLGKALRKGWLQAYCAYLYGDAAGAAVVSNEVGLLLGVRPQRWGQGVGLSLLARLHPLPFLRLAGWENELPGTELQRWVRLQPAHLGTNP